MASGLPRGSLRSARRKGKYGAYTTWKMLRTLAVLYQPGSDNDLPWTSRRLATEVGMAHQSMTRLLRRCKKNGWVKYARDRFGRRAWIILNDGMAFVWKEVNRRIFFKLKKGQTCAEDLLRMIERAQAALRRLKTYGFTDVQARETLINHNIDRVEWAIWTAYRQRQRVVDMGAYVYTLIKHGNQQERRCRIYVQRVNYDLDEAIQDMIVAKAMQTTNAFNAVRLAMREVVKRKDYWEITPVDIGRIFYDLSRSNAIRHKPYYSVA